MLDKGKKISRGIFSIMKISPVFQMVCDALANFTSRRYIDVDKGISLTVLYFLTFIEKKVILRIL